MLVSLGKDYVVPLTHAVFLSRDTPFPNTLSVCLCESFALRADSDFSIVKLNSGHLQLVNLTYAAQRQLTM